MKIEFELNCKDLKINEDRLVKILNCNKDELEGKLAPLALASTEELLAMVLGKNAFSKGSDIREYRLFLMILHGVFAKKIPSDKEVSKLFQTTATSSRALIRSVMSKYQYSLENIRLEQFRDIINSTLPCDKITGSTDNYLNFKLEIHDVDLVSELNSILSTIKPSAVPIRKIAKHVSQYFLDSESYHLLCTYFDLDKKYNLEKNNE